MPITNQTTWDGWVANNTDPYGKCCIDVAREVMRLLDERSEFDPDSLITEADRKIDCGGITGFMAGCVAQMVTKCHSRGEEFREKWNKSYCSDSKTGVVNPAIITIGVKQP